MKDPFDRPASFAGVFYRNPVAALDWLEQAFGFRRSMVLTDPDGALVHAEMRFGDCLIVVDGEWCDEVASPLSTGGRNTQSIYVRLAHGLDTHCERAREAGARIVQLPEDQIHGDRTYRALDPEGHLWTFVQPVRSVSQAEVAAATGWTIEGWHDG
ncbi:VOC family protein [Rhizorhabdus sp.]|uniref:VOC family protein n=1 Tax=Rhizorhabdus sp. TaxID=1968843 RepID=UPI001B4229E8|nr:VOC family protein [Rhizorhabdus sp.]MBP8235155.1 VOC family protein [Rhizorhabdus sp.]